MKKTTYLIVLLFIMVQTSFSQEKYSRIKITNPSESTINTMAAQGIDFSCGSKHDGHDIIIELSEAEINKLLQNNISYTIEIEDMSAFYSDRAEQDLPFANAKLNAMKAASASNNSIQRSSVSNMITNNIIQYTGEDEIDFAVPQNFNLGSWAGCLTYKEMKDELDDMYAYSQTNGLNIVSQRTDASSTNQTTWGNPSGTITNNGLTYSGQGTASSFESDPNIETGKTFWDPETIWYVRITGNQSNTAENTKPQMLFTSMIHSREVSALMNNIYFMWYIIENYNTDPAIKELVDNNELYFVPVVNPDGLRWNEHIDAVADNQVDDGGRFQRKNLRPNTGGTGNTSDTRGVDLNRNFDYYWGYNDIGSSPIGNNNGASGTYRGPSPESEPETQIMVDFIMSRNFKSAVWNHSFANSVPHPYGGEPDDNTGREDEYYRWHEEMTRYNRYLYGATIFYESNGLPDDWMMGGIADLNGSTGSGQGIIATTPEHGGQGFWPTPSTIIPIAQQSMRISLATAYYGGKYAKLHDLTQTSINSTTTNLDFGIERIGQTQSGFTVTVTPISSNIVSITSPSTQTGIPIQTTTNPSFRNQRNVTATLELDPSTSANEKIEYNVKLSNDDGVIYEANYEKYYQPTVLFSHNPDTDGLTGWSQSGGWATTTSDAYSGSTSINTGTYSTNANKTLTTTNSFDFSNSAEVAIQFYSKWDIERNYDFVEVLASPDGGSNWISLKGNYTKPNATSATTGHDNKSSTYANFQANSSGQVYDGDRMDNWVMEEITIDDSYASLLNSNDVKIRFVFRTDALNVNESYTTTNDGFFIDDFKIISQDIPCTLSVPANIAFSTVRSATADVSWDNIPSATYDLRYRETGSSTWIDVSDLTAADYSFTGLTPLTEYEVQIRSTCDTTDSSYSTSEIFTTTEVINCTGAFVDTFPYLETFDGGLGDWSQNSNDDGDWLLDSNGTPSGQTGPSDDISGGGNYLYTEASTPANGGVGSGATLILTSPCYNIANLADANLSFFYHMYGDNLGTLNLEISDDDGSSWTNIFSRSAADGSLDEWRIENINLSSYLGSVIKLRFTAVTGGGFRSDIAIDQIYLGENCFATATDTQELLSIRDVNFNTINNTNTSADTYSDFTLISTTISKNTTYSISITPTYNTATTEPVGYGVWIDYNKDGDFEDAGEEVFTVNPVTGGNAVSGNITTPATILNGNTRMRVAMKWNGVPTSCETFQYGEVEDYTINLFNGLIYSSNAWTPNAPTISTGIEDIMVLDGIYNVSNDISVNNIIVASGSEINIDKANAITVNGNITNNGEFVLNSDSNEFSSLLLNGTANGNIKYNRHVNANTDRNDLIAAPVSGEIFTNFIANNNNIVNNTTNYLFGPFDKSVSDYITYSNSENSALEAGIGYRAASTDDQTFTFKGDVTTSVVNVPVEKTGTAFEQWNLIGNPYTSYIKLEDFINANITEFDTQSVAVYGYDADNTNGSYWTIWNLAYAAANPNTLIAPGQGFFVSSKTGGGTMTFNPTMRSSGSSDDFIEGRTSNQITHFALEMNSETKNFGTDFYITNDASLGLDLGYDAELFEGAPADFAIYSELVENNNGSDLAIQAFGSDDIVDTLIIPLGVNAKAGQQVNISLNNNNIDYDIYLEDRATNSNTLLNTSNYIFTPSSNISNTGRFYLRFEASVLTVNAQDLDTIKIYTNKNEQQIIVQGRLSHNTDLVLYDVQGREINRQKLNINKTENTINTNGLNSGVYIVQVSNDTSNISQKVIIE
ncbi:M14 family zinc carboxypeptidase [Winogradskyella ursingii]|uniref:M14 family zinc carboxypeptidase n=1 Tax=Winogradskyella ursingii TaxID=2686079 RepID=UPI0015CAA1CF|nr:M14 family zinc carboxypeptidase [Winogradskyella ursingii]